MRERTIHYLKAWRGEALQDPELYKRFRWLIDHLLAPQRPGSTRSVCKWVGAAIEDGRFDIGDARGLFPVNQRGIDSIIQSMVKEYRESQPCFIPRDPNPRTLTVAISDEFDEHTIKTALDRHRDKLTPVGIMLGALDPYNSLLSLTGGTGCPYRSPYSFLTIRWMVSCDITFLNMNPTYTQVYRRYFDLDHAPHDNST